MKVFLVTTSEDDVLGVFSSKEKAIESFRYYDQEMDESCITETEVDAVDTSKTYQRLCYSQAFQDGKLDHGDSWKAMDSIDDIKFSYAEFENHGFYVTAFGETHQESDAKAISGVSMIHPVWQVGRAINNPDTLVEVRHAHPSCLHKWALPFVVHEDLNVAREMLMEMDRS